MSLKQRKMLTRKKRKRPTDIPPYIVPLSVQAMEIARHMLEDFKPAQKYLFAGVKRISDRMSENTLNAALKRMGYVDRLTGHGIRATISTALNELGYPKVWVDAQLSHADPNRISATYNHAEYVEQRRVMMQDWADRLDLFEQKPGAGRQHAPDHSTCKACRPSPGSRPPRYRLPASTHPSCWWRPPSRACRRLHRRRNACRPWRCQSTRSRSSPTCSASA